MATKTDAAVATVTEKLGDKALEYLNAFEEVAKQYAPDVVNAALTVVQIRAAGFLLIAAAVSVAIWIFWRYVAPRLLKMANSYDNDVPGILGLIVGGIMTAIGGTFVVVAVFDIWTWVAIFNPKLYIAARIFGRLF